MQVAPFSPAKDLAPSLRGYRLDERSDLVIFTSQAEG